LSVLLNAENPKHVRALQRLATELPIWLTTVNGNGQPQTSPVWFWWDDEAFHLFSRPDAPKVANMRGNPRVSLHLQASETADEDVVIFEGLAAFEAGAPDPDWYEPYVEKYRHLIEEYGWTPESMLEEYSMALRITPSRVRVD
jgi:PPOX class probable F420-dependent enzyme